MDKYRKTLKKWFGFDDFRDKQLEIIKAVLEDKKDVCVVMFTGSGKSLCYQFPAVHANKTALVISPLISLMNDQKMKMDKLKIPTCCLNSTVQFKNSLKDEILNNKYRVILTTPEYLVTQEAFIKELADNDILCLIAIDEAHVSSTWAQDFRTSYTQLGCLREWVPDVPIMALTATATKKVQNDIIKVLELNKPLLIKTTFDRPNLIIKVIPKGADAMSDILNIIKADESTIVYCQTRAITDEIAYALTKNKIKSKAYHAGMNTKDRTQVHEDFAAGKLHCIVATISFGMGIDCTIRKVIHYGVAKDLESYYQEIGRAGRDGLTSHCYMFYALSDFNTVNYFTNQIQNVSYRNHMVQLTLIMKNYIFSSECRRKYILEYFGEVYGKDNCTMCDNCLNVKNVVHYDFAKETSLLFNTMNLTGNAYGGMMLINILRGANTKKINPKYKTSELYGAGKYRVEKWWRIFVSMMVNSNYIKENPVSGGHAFTLSMTKKASEWLGVSKVKKDTKLIMNVPEPLKEFMPTISDKLKKASPDLTGDEFDELIESATSHNKSGKLDKTFELYQKGKTIKQIAIEQDLTAKTIEEHLVKLYKLDKPIDLQKLGFTDEIHKKISQKIEKIGSTKALSPIKNGLPGISYMFIKLSIAKTEKDKEKDKDKDKDKDKNKEKDKQKAIVKVIVNSKDDEKEDKESWESNDDSNSDDISEEMIIVKPKKTVVNKKKAVKGKTTNPFVDTSSPDNKGKSITVISKKVNKADSGDEDSNEYLFI